MPSDRNQRRRSPAQPGYGANQKTCYRTALERGADVVVMVHPDHQYDPRVIPDLLHTLERSACDAVFGSRMLGGRPIQGGMPKWKYLGNILLTAIENATFLIYLTEYHSGFRAYTRRYLEAVNFEANSAGFVFDTEIIAQGMARRLTIQRDARSDRYFYVGIPDRFAPRPVRARPIPEDDGAPKASRVECPLEPDLPGPRTGRPLSALRFPRRIRLSRPSDGG